MARPEKERRRSREGRLVPAMQSLVEIDSVLASNDLVLADFRLLHHGCVLAARPGRETTVAMEDAKGSRPANPSPLVPSSPNPKP